MGVTTAKGEFGKGTLKVNEILILGEEEVDNILTCIPELSLTITILRVLGMGAKEVV